MTLSGFIVLVVVAMIAAVIYILLASMPGKTARARAHPHADAINILGWIGLLLGVAPWLIAMVWARVSPPVAANGVANDDTPRGAGAENDQKAS
jgi:uncharacterized membrane protein YedE/YeeE